METSLILKRALILEIFKLFSSFNVTCERVKLENVAREVVLQVRMKERKKYATSFT